MSVIFPCSPHKEMRPMRSTQSRRRYRLIVIATLAVGAVTLAACSSGSSGSSGATATTAAGGSGASKASTASVTCPSASAVNAVIGTTYTGPQSPTGSSSGTTECDYLAGGVTGLTVTFFPAGTSLKALSANESGPISPIGGVGGSAAVDASRQIAYVSRTSAPSIKIFDHADPQGLDPTELTHLVGLAQ
jgi:hypothetical protein